MVDSFYDGSAYDPETVRFYDVAHEGAQVRLIAGAVSAGIFESVEGIQPRSIIVWARGQIDLESARVIEALKAPLRSPLVISSVLPSYIGALDLLIVLSDNAGDEDALRALTTATQRGARTVLVGPSSGPLVDEAPDETVIVPTLPTAPGISPARIVASISAVLDLLEEDPRIVAERLEHVADCVNAEIELLSPERDELVNVGRAMRLFVEGRRVIHTARTEKGMAVARVVAAVWAKRGLITAVLDYPELVESLVDLRGPAVDVFFDPFLDEERTVVPFRAIVWAEADAGIPEGLAQDCELPGKGALAAALCLIVRGQSATVFSVDERYS